MNEEGVELRREERGVSEKGDAVTSNAHRRPPPHLLNEADVGGRRAKKWERARGRSSIGPSPVLASSIFMLVLVKGKILL